MYTLYYIYYIYIYIWWLARRSGPGNEDCGDGRGLGQQNSVHYVGISRKTHVLHGGYSFKDLIYFSLHSNKVDNGIEIDANDYFVSVVFTS